MSLCMCWKNNFFNRITNSSHTKFDSTDIEKEAEEKTQFLLLSPSILVTYICHKTRSNLIAFFSSSPSPLSTC